jgi:Fe-S-cluster containining protein
VPADPLAGLEWNARGAEQVRTVEGLRRGRTPLALIDVADHAARLTEEAVRRAAQLAPPPPSACREGCDWCCHLTVGTSVPEVARIVGRLRQTLAAEEFHALRERVRRLDERRRELKAAGHAEPGLPCALLLDRRCSVFPVRPLTCRGFNSSDAAQCERFVAGGPPPPIYAPQMRLSAFVLDGMRAGLAQVGLDGELLELTAALRVALEAPAAVERFLAGEPSFASARLD